MTHYSWVWKGRLWVVLVAIAISLLGPAVPFARAASFTLTSNSPTNGQPALSWDVITGADHYDVYRDGQSIATVTAGTFTDSALNEGNYTYSVTAVDANGAVLTTSDAGTLVVDKTPPTLQATLAPAPNAQGWNNQLYFSITFTCSDALSGVVACPDDGILHYEGKDMVTKTIADRAGNTTTVQTPVWVDQTSPVITYTLAPAPDASGQYNGPVTATFTCTDPPGLHDYWDPAYNATIATSGVASCPAPMVIAADQTAAVAVARDNADNVANITVIVPRPPRDITPPVLGLPSWTLNPVAVGLGTAVTLPVSDDSGVAAAEYFVGIDPGVGHATAMNLTSGAATAAVTGFSADGIQTIGFRARDTAGNWSQVTTDYLVVYDPNGPGIAGWYISLAVAASQIDRLNYGFDVDYTRGQLDSHNSLHVTDVTGGVNCVAWPLRTSGCHVVEVEATQFDWLVITGLNDYDGLFQGTATVTMDGVTTTNPFRVEGVDGRRAGSYVPDHFTLKLYAPDADPFTDSPIYELSRSVGYGNAVVIR